MKGICWVISSVACYYMQCVWLIPIIKLNKLYLENYLGSAAHITGLCQTMQLFNRSSSGKMWFQSLLNEIVRTEWYKWLDQQENIQRSRMPLLAFKLLCQSNFKRCLDATVTWLPSVAAICANFGSFCVVKSSGWTPVFLTFPPPYPPTNLKYKTNSLQED